MTVIAPITTTEVRRARPDELPRLARVLARAFADDPVTHYFFPDARQRPAQLPRFFGDLFLARMALGRDEIFTDDRVRGIASWTPPGLGHTSGADMVRLMPRMAALFGRRLPRAIRGLSFMEACFPAEPHWHLPFLAVDPDAQGLGLGSSLMSPILERCDREGVPAYLEASTVRSRALYLRHGFVVLDEMRLPGDGPPLWRMWREPVA